ncbi:MAG: gamma-glutamyltransferase, partial [Leptolyngbyaceae cyanobacterium SL_7_1]|nr:gamma-glutamyltransferase [Leptolyngbyaceae cyanobacterium SL_7_1]
MTGKTHGAIAAGNARTVEAGMEMLRLGGNVFDAVVAAMVASFITEPTLNSIAGGGFLLAHTQDDRNILFDFFCQTPRVKRPVEEIEFYPVTVNFGTATQEFHVGMGSIAVPGAIAGLFHVHDRLGRLPLRTLLEPAIHYAKQGIELDDFQAYCFRILGPIWITSDSMRSVIAPGGKLLQPGDPMVMSDLADTLIYLSETGARGFYEGEIAQRLVRDCQEKGGYLTAEDLRHYQVIERQPLQTSYRGKTLL